MNIIIRPNRVTNSFDLINKESNEVLYADVHIDFNITIFGKDMRSCTIVYNNPKLDGITGDLIFGITKPKDIKGLFRIFE